MIIILFNSFLAVQYTIIKNGSKLPHEFLTNTSEHLSNASFTVDDIAQIINNLDPEEVHRHDVMSISMLKLCCNSIFKPLVNGKNLKVLFGKWSISRRMQER